MKAIDASEYTLIKAGKEYQPASSAEAEAKNGNKPASACSKKLVQLLHGGAEASGPGEEAAEETRSAVEGGDASGGEAVDEETDSLAGWSRADCLLVVVEDKAGRGPRQQRYQRASAALLLAGPSCAPVDGAASHAKTHQLPPSGEGGWHLVHG